MIVLWLADDILGLLDPSLARYLRVRALLFSRFAVILLFPGVSIEVEYRCSVLEA